MKEFIEKLIGRLKEELGNRNFEKATKEVNVSFYEGLAYAYGYSIGTAIQLAEEYINCSTDTSSGWIPCSERLPEDSGRYLVTIKNATRAITLHYFEGSWHDGIRHHYDVIAWMPLPPAYVPKEGRE